MMNTSLLSHKAANQGHFQFEDVVVKNVLSETTRLIGSKSKYVVSS
jgi:hypothetical protein